MCANIRFNLRCAAAVGVASSSDHLITGLNNFGKKASEQRPTITVQSLKRLGLSEQAANYVQLAMDTLSVGKAGISTPRPKPATPITVRITSGGKANALTGAALKLDLKTTQAANEVVESLRDTGKLPSNYVTKNVAEQKGWIPSKAVNNYVPGGQIGGDVYRNTENILPNAHNRI